MNLLSALPEFKRNTSPKEGEMECDSPELNQMIGWDSCIDDLAKYQLCDESLAKVICALFGNDINKVKPGSVSKEWSKEIISSTHLWIKRKDVK